MNQALKVWGDWMEVQLWWLCKRRGFGGLLSWAPHPVDWMTPHNLIHSVIMPNGGNTMKEKKNKTKKGSRIWDESISFSEYFMKNHISQGLCTLVNEQEREGLT